MSDDSFRSAKQEIDEAIEKTITKNKQDQAMGVVTSPWATGPGNSVAEVEPRQVLAPWGWSWTPGAVSAVAPGVVLDPRGGFVF